jgi:hypothetical protein
MERRPTRSTPTSRIKVEPNGVVMMLDDVPLGRIVGLQ